MAGLREEAECHAGFETGTASADTCTAAGFLATQAMLNGPDAESLLAAQDVKYHCIR